MRLHNVSMALRYTAVKYNDLAVYSHRNICSHKVTRSLHKVHEYVLDVKVEIFMLFYIILHNLCE